ncbi:MAG: hypothetical protein PH343_09815, partial [Nitrospira sp.]|nr:hypothetical protein [Nitrospira sp.]
FPLIVFVFLSAFSNVSNVSAVLIDRIAATVDSEVITYSDVQIERVFRLPEAGDGDALQELIDRRLLLMEAKKFKITETEEDGQKIQKRFQEIKNGMDGDKFDSSLREYNLTEPDIIKILKEKYLAEKFINFRINFFVIIPDNTVKTYYSEHKTDFLNRPLEDVYDEVKVRLFQSESRKRLEDFMVQLRRKAKVTINQISDK